MHSVSLFLPAVKNGAVEKKVNDAEEGEPTLEEGRVCPSTKTDLSVKGQDDPGDPGMVAVSPVVSSASQSVIAAVQTYCQNIQISVSEYFQEENQKLACLVSNIKEILNSKSNPTPSTVVQDYANLVNGVADQDDMEHEDIEKKPIKTEMDEELQQLQNIKRDLKQQVEAFHILAKAPQLKAVCHELTVLLDKQPLNLEQLTKSGSSTADGAALSATATSKIEKADHNSEDLASKEMVPLEGQDPGLMAVTPETNSDREKNGDADMSPMAIDKKENCEDLDSDANDSSDSTTVSDSDLDSDESAPPKKKIKTADLPPAEIPLSLEEKVFGNQLVIKAVFKSLDTKSLKNLRVVSKNFNNFATEILVLKQSLKILISHDRVRLNKDNGQLVNLDLNQALQSITNSIKLFHRLPTDHMELLNTNLEAPALQNFLTEYGYLVKTLKLDFYSGNVSVFAFQHLLQHQVVNLETLFFDNVPPSWKKICADLKLFRDHHGWVKMNSLKKVKVGPQRTCVVPPNLLQNLVCASANLREVKGCRGTNFMAFLPNDDTNVTTSSTSLSNLHLMKTLTFDPRPETLPLYSQFLAGQGELPTCLQIQKLEIEMEELLSHPETWPQLTSILSQFLQMSSATLEKLVINDRLGFLEKNDLEFPKFPKVTKVNLIIVEDHTLADFQKKIFPSNCQIAHAFPNVQDLKITIWENSEEDHCDVFFKYFGNPLPIPSLKKLELICQWDCQLPLYWLEQFSALAPNVKVANFGVLSIGDFGEASKSVWTLLLNLQELKFTLDVDTFVMEGCMDVAFTGFTEETCKRLRKQQFNRIQSQSQNPGMQKIETVVRAEDWEDERENACILDLKSLTSLRVDFVMKSVRKNPYPVFLSCVAGLYAFKMCKNLKVSIGVDTSQGEDPTELNKSLETIRPYVTMDSSHN